MNDLAIKIEHKLKTESVAFEKKMAEVKTGVFDSSDINEFRVMSFEYGYRRGFLAAIAELDNVDQSRR